MPNPTRPGEGLPDPTLLNMQMYADTVSREMFPHKRQDQQRDAARHMLAAAIAAQKTSSGTADLLGRLHELKEAPIRTLRHWVNLGEPRSDYPVDIHNNRLGIEIASGLNPEATEADRLRALLDLVQATVQIGTPKIQIGHAALTPDVATNKYARGGLAKFKECHCGR